MTVMIVTPIGSVLIGERANDDEIIVDGWAYSGMRPQELENLGFQVFGTSTHAQRLAGIAAQVAVQNRPRDRRSFPRRRLRP